MASDVGGGTSLSMQRTLLDAYKVQALQGVKLTAFKALHAATQGAAQALGLAHEIGSLEPGHTADLCIWDWAVGPVARHRDELARSQARGLHERLFAWLTLADERNLRAAWVAGQPRFAATTSLSDPPNGAPPGAQS
jgi:guanine deaminase